MKSDQFDFLCASLYDLTPQQRETLGALLASRHWLYEAEECDELTLELLHEAPSRSLIGWLDLVSLDDLAYALKGCSPALLSKISQLLPKDASASLAQKMKDLGPVRLSQKLAAETQVLAAWRSLLAENKVDAAPVHRAIGLHPQPFGDAIDAIRRRDCQLLHSFRNEVLPILMREVPLETVADMLGYVNDPRLIRRFLLVGSTVQGQTILERLLSHWPKAMNKTPTTDEPEFESFLARIKDADNGSSSAAQGRGALDAVLATLGQLIDEGQICRE